MMGSRTGNPVWQDHPDTSTPVTAARLNAIEDAIDDSAEAAHYDAHLNLYVPSGTSLAGWRNRVQAARRGRSTTVLALGSSSVQGLGSGDVSNGWAYRLRSRFSDAGYPVESTGLAFVGSAMGSVTDARWSFSGSMSNASGSQLWAEMSPGAWAQFAPDVPGTRVRVHYLNSGEAFTVSVNGGSAATVTPDGTSSTASWLSPSTASVSTVRVTASGTARIVGVEVFNTTPGISITVAGLGGTSTAQWQDVFTHTSNSRVALGRVPALAVLAINGNDFSLGVSPSVTGSRLESMINGLRYFNCEPMILAMPVTSSQNYDDYRAHVAGLYEVATSTGTPLIDMQDRWGRYDLISGAGLSADGTHPSTRGHELYADAIFDVIG